MNEEAIRVPAKHTFLKKKSIMSSYWDRDDSDTETSPAPKPVLEPALLQHLKNHPVLKPAKVLAYANSSSQLMRTKLVLALQRTQNAAGLTKLATHSRVAEEIGKEEIEQAMENLVHVTPPEVKLDTSSYTDPNVKVLKSILKGKDTLRKSKHARFASQNSLVQTLKLHYEIENLSCIFINLFMLFEF